MTGAEIGNETAGRDVDDVCGAKQFAPHEGAGQGCIRRSRKNSHKPDGGEKIGRHTEKGGQRMSQTGANEEKRRDFPALEAGRQGCDREDKLLQPAPRVVTQMEEVED